MIRCLLLLVTRNRLGEAMRDERVAVGENLRIGRGTDCAVHLPDSRVMLLHATIRTVPGGFLIIGHGRVVKSDGRFESEVRLQPGSSVLVGPYRLTAETGREGYDLVLSVELVEPLPDESHLLAARSRTSLARTALSMRGLAIGLFVLVLAVFLAWPLVTSTVPHAHAQDARLPAPDASWNPGPMSDAHRTIAGDCKQCHQLPFVRVQDSACIACHRGIGDHVANKALQSKAFGQTRCAQCHLEHRGNAGLQADHAGLHGNLTGLCENCHGRGIARESGLPAIHDFRDDHPPFRVTLPMGAAGLRRMAPSAASPMREESGLKFPHKLHLAAAGIDSPAGRVQLKCASCHVADEAGVRFEPVTMAKHCESCHRLEFEPAVTHRTVPHGDESAVMTVLREFYAGISIGRTPIEVTTQDGLLRKPGPPVAFAHRQAGAWAEAKAMAVARDLFEVRSCTTCHRVIPQPGDLEVPWKVTPVALNRHWLPHARFEHSAHADVRCDSCHRAAQSTTSADVDIPGIATCRNCHAGAEPEAGKVISTCSSCHGFHAAKDAPAASKIPASRIQPGRTPASQGSSR
jgi:predicted CXXCH cytochrome family protein